MSKEHFAKYPPTPRVYYRWGEKLLGRALETEVINPANFDFIMNNADNRIQQSVPRSRLVMQNGELTSVWIEQFAYMTLSDDGIFYTDEDHGEYYLPKALIFYDVPDALFPSYFCFLAKINGQLELCEARCGEGRVWHNMAAGITPASDPSLVKKVEATLEGIYQRVEYAAEQREQQWGAAEEREAKRGGASAEFKAACSSLLNICLPKGEHKGTVRGMIASLKDYESEGEGETFLHLLMQMNRELIPFFVLIDWKTSVSELRSWVRDALENNFGYSADVLPDPEDDEDVNVAEPEGFPACAAKLGKLGLEFSFVDTGHDEYVFIIHPAKEQTEVRRAFGVLGLKHQTLADLYK